MSAFGVPPGDSTADLPLDAYDDLIMSRIAALYQAIDPVPEELTERLQFAITLDALSMELAELERLPETAAARSSAHSSEVRTLTFTSDSLTTMVAMSPDGPDRLRIDGWVAPCAGVSVELRQGLLCRHATADPDGRFVFEDVAHGLTRFVVRAPEPASHPPVATPAVEI